MRRNCSFNLNPELATLMGQIMLSTYSNYEECWNKLHASLFKLCIGKS